MSTTIERITDVPFPRVIDPELQIYQAVVDDAPLLMDQQKIDGLMQYIDKTYGGVDRGSALTRDALREAVSRLLLPLFFDDLAFLQLAPPEIKIIAPWSQQKAVTQDIVDMSAVITGKMPVVPFFLVFALLCRIVSASTTAHRRYKGKDGKDNLNNRRCIIEIDVLRDNVDMYMSQDLIDVINTSFALYWAGR